MFRHPLCTLRANFFHLVSYCYHKSIFRIPGNRVFWDRTISIQYAPHAWIRSVRRNSRTPRQVAYDKDHFLETNGIFSNTAC